MFVNHLSLSKTDNCIIKVKGSQMGEGNGGTMVSFVDRVVGKTSKAVNDWAGLQTCQTERETCGEDKHPVPPSPSSVSAAPARPIWMEAARAGSSSPNPCTHINPTSGLTSCRIFLQTSLSWLCDAAWHKLIRGKLSGPLLSPGLVGTKNICRETGANFLFGTDELLNTSVNKKRSEC